MANRRRDVSVFFRTTEAEKQMIVERMRTCGYNDLGKYLREIAIDGYIVHVQHEEIKELTYEINKIGVNINQIAHHVNETGIIFQSDMAEIRERIDEIWQLLRYGLLNQP